MRPITPPYLKQLSTITGDNVTVDKIPVIGPAPAPAIQYCRASPPELLLDIISQSRYVKQHECTIEKTDIDPAPNCWASQYCRASPPELLLDIIGQSRYVKQHECIIEKIDIDPAPNCRASQYCRASPPELLLDIIGQSLYVKQHECTIETIERPIGANKDIRQPASLNHCRTDPFLVYSAIPRVQQIPSAMKIPIGVATTTGLPSSQLVCYDQ